MNQTGLNDIVRLTACNIRKAQCDGLLSDVIGVGVDGFYEESQR